MGEEEKSLEELSDNALVEGIMTQRVSEQAGLEEMFARLVPRLGRYLYSKVEDEQLVSDIIAETLLVLWQSISEGKYDYTRGNPGGYAYGIARNKMLEAFRARGKEISFSDLNVEAGDRLRSEDASKSIAESYAYKKFHDDALTAVLSLSEAETILFLIKSNYDLTFEQVAAIWNQSHEGAQQVTADTLAQRYHRAKLKLRIAIDREG